MKEYRFSVSLPFLQNVWLLRFLFRWAYTWQRSFLPLFLWTICRKWVYKLDRNSLRYLMNNTELPSFKYLTRAEWEVLGTWKKGKIDSKIIHSSNPLANTVLSKALWRDHIRKGLKLGFLKAYLDCLSLFVACCLLHSIKSKNIQRETKILHRNYQCFKGIFLMYVRCYSYCIPTLWKVILLTSSILIKNQSYLTTCDSITKVLKHIGCFPLIYM